MDKIITSFLALIGIFALLFFFTTSYGGYNKGTLVHHDGELDVFIFDTPYELKTGLSGKSGIGKDQGALFIFGKPGLYEFVTVGMKISVDMIWLDADMNVVGITENIPPCLDDINRRCPDYTPPEPILFVVEVGAGYCKDNDIQEGDHFELLT